MDPACGTRRCLQWRVCSCGARFLTDEADRFYCMNCDPPEPSQWKAFR